MSKEQSPMGVTVQGQQGQSVSMSMMPSTFNDAVVFAQWMARSKMVPKDFQQKPEDCLVIIEQAIRWEMSPYAVIQCASMIHGRPMYEGKLVAAVVNSRGPRYGLSGRLKFDYTGTGPERTVKVSGLLDGRTESVEVIWKDAKTDNGMWIKQPDQQLAYHGSRVWARRLMPELMLGVYSPEEMEIAPAASDTFSGTTIEAKAEHAEPPQPPKQRTAREFFDEIEAAFDAATTTEDVDAIMGRDDVQKARDTFRNSARDKLNAVIKAALDRTAPAKVAAADDGWPGPDVPAAAAA